MVYSCLVFCVILAVCNAARYQVVGHKDQTQLIQLKSQFDISPGGFTSLNIDVEEEHLSVYGKLPPKLKEINSENDDGIYGNGDVVVLTLEFTSPVNVSGVPSLTVNTGCHSEDCFVPEIQQFSCASDIGSFALRLENQFIMTIDSNTTQDAFKYKLEALDGVNEVTVSYSSSGEENTMRNSICTPTGNTVTITFEDVSFPQYDGDVPSLQFDRLNWYDDPRSGLSQGNVEARLMGIHNEYVVNLTDVAVEVQRGIEQRDGTAYYVSGAGTNVLTFYYTVRDGDLVDDLNVASIDFLQGYIFSPITGENVSTAVPAFGAAYRYMDSSPSSLGHVRDIIITSDIATVAYVTSPDANGVYTQGDSVTIYVVFDLPIKYYGTGIYLLFKPGQIFRRAYVDSLLDDKKTLVFKYYIAAGDIAADLDYLSTSALVLDDGEIYRFSVNNASAADVTLPPVGSANSLSYIKDIAVDTNSPLVLDFELYSAPGNYTAGDDIDLLLRYDYAVTVVGTPVIWVKNMAATHTGARVRTAPLGQEDIYNRATSGDVSAITVQWRLNWMLYPGDFITVKLPLFEGMSNDDLYLYSQDEYAPLFDSEWNTTTSSITFHMINGTIAPFEDIILTVQSRSGVRVSSYGVVAASSDLSYSVTSALFNTTDLGFMDIGAVSFSSMSLSITPYTAGSAVVLHLSFAVPETLVYGDEIYLHLRGFQLVDPSVYFSSAHPLFDFEFDSNSSTLLLNFTGSSTDLLFDININDYLSFVCPSTGVGSDTVTVDARMTYNGVLYEMPIPSISHICSNPLASVVYDTHLPGATSGVEFQWTVGVDAISPGDTVSFTLPPDGSIETNSARDITAFLLSDGEPVLDWTASVTDRVVTFTAENMVTENTVVSLSVSSSAGILVPSNGIKKGVDTFAVMISSINCQVSSATDVYFSEYVIPISTPRMIVTTDVIGSAQVGIELSFTISEDLATGDVIVLNLPYFNRPGWADPYGSNVTSVIDMEARYNRLKKRFEFILEGNYTADGSPVAISVSSNPGLFLPSNGMQTNDGSVTMSIESVNGLADSIAVSNPCIGFCSAYASYSTAVVSEELSASFSLTFSHDLVSTDMLIVVFNGIGAYNNNITARISSGGLITTWTDITMSSMVPMGMNITATDAFTVIVEGLTFTGTSGDVTVTIVNSNAKPSGALYAKMDFPGEVYIDPNLLSTEISFEGTNVNELANASFTFQPERLLLAGYRISIYLPDFDLQAVVISSDSGSGNFSLDADLIHDAIRLTARNDLPALSLTTIVFEGVGLPYIGVDENSSLLCYSIDFTDMISTEKKNFSRVNGVDVIRDADATFTFDDIANLQTIDIMFWSNINIQAGDLIYLTIPGVKGPDSVSNISSSLPGASRLFASNSTFDFVLSGALNVGLVQFSVDASGYNPIYLPQAGFTNASIGAISIIQNVLNPVLATEATVSLPCIGVCVATLSASVGKAGFATDYSLDMSFSADVHHGDVFVFELIGFEKDSESYFSVYHPDVIVTGVWNISTQQLTLAIELYNNTGSIGTRDLSLELPRDILLRLPDTGIGSESNMFDMSWSSAVLGNISGSLLTVKPISTLTAAEIILSPQRPNEIANITIVFQISNALSVGDVVHISLYEYGVDDGPRDIYGSDKDKFSVEGVSADLESNIASLLFTCIYPVPSYTLLSIEVFDIVLPVSGVHADTIRSTISIVSTAKASMSAQRISNYTRVGSLQGSSISFVSDRWSNSISVQFSFTALCALSAGDTIDIFVPGLRAFDHPLLVNSDYLNISGTWISTSSTMSLALNEDIPIGNLNFTALSSELTFMTDIYYPNDRTFTFTSVSDMCPIDPTPFAESSAIGMVSSSISFNNAISGDVTSISLTFAAVDDLTAGDVVLLNLTGFTRNRNTSALLDVYGTGVDYTGNITIAADPLNNTLIVNIPIISNVSSSQLLSFDIHESNGISLPVGGIDSLGTGIALTLQLVGTNSSRFTGGILNVQPVGHFFNKVVDVELPRPGVTSAVTVTLAASDELLVGDAVTLHLPRFSLVSGGTSTVAISLEGVGASYFSGTWNPSSKSVVLTVIRRVPSLTDVRTTIVSGTLLTPLTGISVEELLLYTISAASVNVPVLSTTLGGMTTIPAPAMSAVSFVASDAWDAVTYPDSSGLYSNRVLLYPGHNLNDDDIGATITLCNVLYTIRSVNIDIIELEEVYDGEVISFGLPVTYVYTPDTRPAYYLSGSNTTELIFRYTARKGDLSYGLDVHNTTSSTHVTEPMSLLTENDKLLRHSSNPSVHLNRDLPEFDNGRALYVDSTRPIVTCVSSSSAPGTYTAGDIIDIQVTFSHRVLVSTGVVNSPALLLQKPSGDIAIARYLYGAGSDTLTFSYTIQEGDMVYSSRNLIRVNDSTSTVVQPLRIIMGNQFNFIRRYAVHPTIDIEEVIPESAVRIPHNISWVGDGTYVTGITVVPGEANEDDVYTSGDDILLYVHFSGGVYPSPGPGNMTIAEQFSILLEVGKPSGEPGVAGLLNTSTDNTTLVFSYNINDEDSLLSGLSLYCTCEDFFNRTLIRLADGAQVIESGDRNIPASIVLARDSSAGSLLLRESYAISNSQPFVTRVSANVSAGVYSPGASIILSVHFSGKVSSIGITRLVLSGDNTDCVAHFYDGNNTDTLKFLYIASQYSRSAVVSCRYIDALDTSLGNVYRYSQRPTIVADVTLPVPGSMASVGVQTKITIDSTAVKPLEIVSRNGGDMEKILPLANFHLRSAASEKLHVVYLYNQEDGGVTVEFNASEDVFHRDLQKFIDDPMSLTTLFSGSTYNSILIEDVVNSHMLYAPQVATTVVDDNLFFKNDQWWSSDVTTGVFELGIHYDRPVVYKDVYIPLNTGSVLNNAVAQTETRVWKIVIDLRNVPEGDTDIALQQYQLRYGGWTTACIAVGGSLEGVMSLHAKLDQIESLRQLGLSVQRVTDNSDRKEYLISSQKPASHEILIAPSFSECMYPLNSERVTITGEGVLNFRYNIRSTNAIVLQSNSTIPAGVYELALHESNGLYISEFGLDSHGIALEHRNVLGSEISRKRTPVTPVPHVGHSSLVFSADALPGDAVSIHVTICVGMTLEVGDEIVITLPSFMSNGGVNISSIHESYSVAWRAASETLLITVTEALHPYSCVDASVNKSFGLFLPYRAILDRNIFQYEIHGVNGKVDLSLFGFVTETVISQFSLVIHNPIPRAFSKVTISFHTNVEIAGNSTITVWMPEFRLAHSQWLSAVNQSGYTVAPLILTGPYSHAFNAMWLNESAVQLISCFDLKPAEYTVSISESSKIIVATPSTAPVRIAPYFTVEASNWTLDATTVLDFTEVIGVSDSSFLISVTRPTNKISSLRFSVNFTYDIEGPINITLIIPSLLHAHRYERWEVDMNSSVTWTEFDKTFLYSTSTTISNDTTFELELSGDQLSHFTMEASGVPSGDLTDIIYFSVDTIRGYLPVTPVHRVSVVPTILFASLQYSEALFSLVSSEIIIDITVNTFVRSGDVFSVHLYGTDNISSTNSSVECRGRSGAYTNVAYDSDSNTLLLTINDLYDSDDLDLRWIIPAEYGITRPQVVVQYEAEYFSVEWNNSFSNTGPVHFDVFPIGPFLSSSIEFESPYSGHQSDMTVKIITTTEILQDDIIVLTLADYSFLWATTTVLDALNNSWIVTWDGDAYELGLRAPKQYSLSAFEFIFAGSIGPHIPVLGNNYTTPKITLIREEVSLVSDIVKYVQPIGGMEPNASMLVHVYDTALTATPVIDVSVELNFLCTFSVGDTISVYKPHFTFLYDSDIRILGFDVDNESATVSALSEYSAAVVSDDDSIVFTVLKSGLSSLRLSVRSDEGALITEWPHCSRIDNSCPVEVSASSLTCPTTTTYVFADYRMKFSHAGINFYVANYSVSGDTFTPSAAPATMSPSMSISDPTSIPSSLPSGVPTSIPSASPTVIMRDATEYVFVELSLRSQIGLLNGTSIRVAVPQLYEVYAVYENFTIVDSMSREPRGNIFRARWEDLTETLVINVLSDTVIPSWDITVISPHLSLRNDIVYENDQSVLYDIVWPDKSIERVRFDSVVPHGLKSSALRFDEVYAGSTTSIDIVLESASTFDSNSVVYILLPGFQATVTEIDFDVMESSCSRVGNLGWNASTSTVSVYFTGICSLVHITLLSSNEFQSSPDGVNSATSLPTVSLALTDNDELMGPTEFSTFTPVVGIRSTSISFNGTVISGQPTLTKVSFGSVASITTNDYIDIYMPRFWASQYSIATYDCDDFRSEHLVFEAEWIGCSETLRLRAIDDSFNYSHCVVVDGLRVPHNGVSVHLADIVVFTGSTTSGKIYSTVVEDMQLVGHVLYSSISFTNASLASETGLKICFQLSTVIRSGESVMFMLPGVTISGSVVVYSEDDIERLDDRFSSTWSATSETLTITAVETQISEGEMVTVFVGSNSTYSGIILPTVGISLQETRDFVVSTDAIDGPVLSAAVTEVQTVGIEAADIHYNIFDITSPVEVRVHFRFSHPLLEGDVVSIYAPCLEGQSMSMLSVRGGSAVHYFESAGSIAFDNNTKVLSIVMTSDHVPFTDLDFHIGIENMLYISSSGTLNQAHSINATTVSLGSIFPRVLEHSPSNIVGVSALDPSLHCYLDDSYTASCSLSVFIDIGTSLENSTTLVLSHPNWDMHERPSSILSIGGNASGVFNAMWRASDNTDKVAVKSSSVLLESSGYLYADENIDYHSVDTGIPPLQGATAIYTSLPRVRSVYGVNTSDLLVCGDAIFIAVEFTEAVSFSSSVANPLYLIDLKLLLNTEEYAYYYSGNATDTILFYYHVENPVDVSDLGPLGPAALEFSSSVLHQLGNPNVVVNTTISEPYGSMLRRVFPHRISVQCRNAVGVENINICPKLTSAPPQFIQPGDTIDICVEFERDVEVSDDIDATITFAGYSTVDGGSLVGEYINVSSEQWLMVNGRVGSYVVSYQGSYTACISWDDTNALEYELSQLDALKDALPVEITPYAISDGISYRLAFDGLAPSVLETVPYQCPYEPETRIMIPASKRRTVTFRRTILATDSYESNRLSLNDTNAISVSKGGIYVSTFTQWITLTNNAASVAPADSSLSVNAANVIVFTGVAEVVRVYSNFSVVGQAGDVIDITVVYPTPVTVIGYPFLELDVVNLGGEIRRAVLLDEYVAFRQNSSPEIVFSYIVEHGDVASPLTELNNSALRLNDSHILLSSMDPSTPVNITLPKDSVNGLNSSNITVDATLPPRIHFIDTDVPAGEYGAGQDIIVRLTFYSEVFISVANGSDLSIFDAYIRVNSSADGKNASYIGGSGTKSISFLYVVETGDYSKSLSLVGNDANGSCVEIMGDDMQFEDALGNKWSEVFDCGYESMLNVIAIDTSAPEVWRVTSTNKNGEYYPGSLLDITVMFTKPVVILSDSASTPSLELFVPHQIKHLLAWYSHGNGTDEIHFSYIVPPPPTGIFLHPNVPLDYAGTSALYQHLNGTIFKRLATTPTTEARVQLPAEDQSFVRYRRDILLRFQVPAVMSVEALNVSGVYTCGDFIVFQVTFTQPVMTFYPPVLRLNTGSVHRDAVYLDGNGTTQFLYGYTVQDGDEATKLDYVDTREAPYSTKLDASFALSTDIIKGSSGRLNADLYGGAGRSNDIVLFRESHWGQVYRLSDVAYVPALLDLPLPGADGSLSSMSNIRIDTTPPNITRIFTTIPDGSYGSGVDIPVIVRFSQEVVVYGDPTIKFFISRTDRYATITDNGNGTTDIKFVYSVNKQDSMSLFDYEDRYALKFPTYLENGEEVTFGSVRRKSQAPGVLANTTLAWVTYVESVLSSTSISGSGHRITLSGVASAVPTEILVDSLQRSVSVGDVLSIRVVFSSPVSFNDNSTYLLLNSNTSAYFAYQENETSALFYLTIQPEDDVSRLSYPNIFSLRTSSSCSIIDLTTGLCAAQNIPEPSVEDSDGDRLSPAGIKISSKRAHVSGLSILKPALLEIENSEEDNEVSRFCDSSGSSWIYIESVDVNSSTRIITRSSCPNHYNVCQKNDCIDDKSDAVFELSTLSIPLYPKFSTSPRSTLCTPGALAVALNGVDLYGQLDDSTECGDAVNSEGVTFDKCGGHSDSSGVYHYHVPPVCLLEQLGNKENQHSPQIGWALDGFPVYGNMGPSGILMWPCGARGAHKKYCLDSCNGYFGSLSGVDEYMYRYYTSGETASGECSGNVRYSGLCERENDPCCISAVPSVDFNPYTIGCFMGCTLGDSACLLSSSRDGYTDSFTPAVAAHPTVVFDGTEATTQAFVDAMRSELIDSTARTTTYLPNQSSVEVHLVEVENGGILTTGDRMVVVVVLSESIIVQGSPVLVMYIDNDVPLYLNFVELYNSSSLLFDYVVDGELHGSVLSCARESEIDLNNGRILLETNFMPVVAADLKLGATCCYVECDKTVIVVDTLPSVSRVFSSQNGTFSDPDELEIFVEFTGPVTVVGEPSLALKLFGTPHATFAGMESDRVLKFIYVIQPGDTTSALDYISSTALQFIAGSFYDGVFMANVYESLEVDLTLPYPGESGSLGRSNTIIMDETRAKNVDITLIPLSATAGDVLTISFAFNRNVTVMDNSALSLFKREATPMYIRFNITADHDESVLERVAIYNDYIGNSVNFVYPVTAADPSGPITISEEFPIILGDYIIVDEETGVLTGMKVDDAIVGAQIGAVDNDVPHVVRVTSPNISETYPWGIGDVVQIIIEMSSPVAVIEVPRLRLAFDNDRIAYASFSSDHIPSLTDFECYQYLRFEYAIAAGDSAFPLEYDGINALIGDLRRCVADAAPTIPADLTLPYPFTDGSVGFCCPMNIESTPPYVRYLMPLKKSGVYGLNEQIVILARFSKPVVVFGVPVLEMYSGSGNSTYAYYNNSFYEKDVLVNIGDTDVLFSYFVSEEDDAVDLHHLGKSSIILQNASILHRTQSPITEADISLRDPDDHELLRDKVEQQWKFGYPAKVEIVVRDFYHTDPAQLLVRLEHLSRDVTVFDSCCLGGSLGRTVPGTRLGNNVSTLGADTGIGSDLFFSDTRAENIARRGVANQSSTEFGGVASRAIDGSNSPVYGDRTTTETSASDYDGWWQLHLPIGSKVRSINIWPRTPQLWIPAVVSVTVKAYDQFPRGRFKLQFDDIEGDDPTETSVVTAFIEMGATAKVLQKKINALGSLAQLSVSRETIVGDGVEKGHGWKYLVTFNGVEIAEPVVNIVESSFVGGVDVIDGEEQENILGFQLVKYSQIESRGFAKSVSRVANFVGGVDGLNSWLVPYWVMLFKETGEQPPLSLNDSIAEAVWLRRFNRIDKLEQIVLTEDIENIGYVKIQREGPGALALAEVEVFEVKLNSLLWYTEGYPVNPASVVRPYQPVDSFANAFNNIKFNDRWSLQITASPFFTSGNIRGWEGSTGTVSDWVLVVTDFAGVVRTFYQDLRAEVKALPKYGALYATTTGTHSSYGEWKDAFELTEDGVLEASPAMKRALGICNGVDTTGMNGVRSGVSQYRYCKNNYGVGTPLNNRIDGDYAIQRFLRRERVLYYVPRLNYLGPDFFTYIIYDGPVVQNPHLGHSEVTVHVRECRDSQASRVEAGVHALCVCSASEYAVIDSWSECSGQISKTCSDSGGQDVFWNLCVACESAVTIGDLSAIPVSCVSEVIRVMGYLTSNRQCDISPHYDCRDEITTNEGQESYNYLSLMSYPWKNPFSSVRDYTGDS